MNTNEFAIKMAILDAKDAYNKLEYCQRILQRLFQEELKSGMASETRKNDAGESLYDIVNENRDRYLTRYHNLCGYIKSLCGDKVQMENAEELITR